MVSQLFCQLKMLIPTVLLLVGSIENSFGDEWIQPPEAFNNNDNNGLLFGGVTDGNGRAIGLYRDDSGLFASYYSNGVWTPQLLDSTTTNESVIAMDATGTALAMWFVNDMGNDVIRTAQFNAGVWTTPAPNPLTVLSSPGFHRIAVAMNGSGEGVGVWIDDGNGQVNASFFNGVSWEAPSVIGAATPASMIPIQLSVVYSASGRAVAIWSDNGILTANFSNAGVWSSPVIIGNPVHPSNGIDLGIDAAGNAYAVFIFGGSIPDDLIVSHLDLGGTWNPQEIVPGFAETPHIGVAPGGTAVITWIEGGAGWSSSFNGTAWGPPVQYTPSIGNFADVSVDSAGNALAIYQATFGGGQILSAQLPLGGVWGNYLVVADTDFHGEVISALSNGGVGFAFWQEAGGEGPFNAFGSVLIPSLFPPVVSGEVCKNKFASQTDRIHIISWIPVDNPLVTAYYLRRNGVLIAIFPASGPYTYADHNRCRRTDVYTVSYMTILGMESPFGSVILR